MSIAQHLVAGEGNTHPFDQDRIRDTVDEKALSQFTCDTTNLPWVIFRAAFRAEHLSELPARARALLAALARTVDASRPYASIFARRKLLTGRALQSMRTFYRSLDDLERAGLIYRPPQKRHGEDGSFGRAYLHLTVSAAQLLGLAEPAIGERPLTTHTIASTPVASSEPTVPASVDVGPVEPPAITEPTPFAPPAGPDVLPSASVADGAIYKDLIPVSFQKRQPGKLPADLERLLPLGFRKYYVFKLMKTASTAGKRLSDIVAVCWPHLVKARRPISYLNALIHGATDFACQARALQDTDIARREAELERVRLEYVRAHIAGQVFFSRDGKNRYEVAADRVVLIEQRVDEREPRTNNGGWLASFAAALEDGRILRATDELTMTFEGARQNFASSSAARSTAPIQRQRERGPRVLTDTISMHLSSLKAHLRGQAALSSIGAPMTQHLQKRSAA